MCNASNWFTVENIDNATFAISEYGHWTQVHSYLFIGKERAALIDTGLGIANIKEVVQRLTNLPILVITTHVHADHIGGHSLFTEIAVHENDKSWLENGIPIPIEQFRKYITKEPFTKKPPESFRIENYTVFTGSPSRILIDSETIELGNRTLEVLHTPGHSPGHICIFERDTGYLVTGDLLYEGTLYAFFSSTDPQLFAKSIHRLNALSHISTLLPGHNRLDIPVDLLSEADNAFDEISVQNKLKQGTGLHEFERISIKL